MGGSLEINFRPELAAAEFCRRKRNGVGLSKSTSSRSFFRRRPRPRSARPWACRNRGFFAARPACGPRFGRENKASRCRRAKPGRCVPSPFKSPVARRWGSSGRPRCASVWDRSSRSCRGCKSPRGPCRRQKRRCRPAIAVQIRHGHRRDVFVHRNRINAEARVGREFVEVEFARRLASSDGSFCRCGCRAG
jgi:hypothetical protein